MSDWSGGASSDGAPHPPTSDQGALIAIDAQGFLTVWSPSAEALLGYSQYELLGQRLSRLLATPPPAFWRNPKERAVWMGTLAFKLEGGEVASLSAQAYRLSITTDQNPSWFIHLKHFYPAEPSSVRLDDIDQAVLRWLFARSSVALTVYDEDFQCLRQSAAMSRLTGVPETESRGMRPSEILPGGADWEEKMRRSIESGVAAPVEVRSRVPAHPQSDRLITASVNPIFGSSGHTIGLCSMATDITEQRRARERLTLLNEASANIGSTLDVLTTARELTDVLCPRLADWIHIDLLESMLRGEEPGPFIDQVALYRAAHKSFRTGVPESVAQLGEVDFYPAHSPPVRCMAMNESTIHAATDQAMRDWLAEDPKRASRFRAHQWHSVMAVPIAAREAILGVAVLLRSKQEAFTDEDRLLTEEIVSRAAVCLDNARRYTRERTAALALQQSLLPQMLGHQAAVETAGRYLPADALSGVGGDWFDVIALSGKRVALVVGDVVGHGINAAATMGRLRTAVRTMADVDLPPDELLTHLDDVLTRLREESEHPDQGGGLGATCTYVVYDPISRMCSIASAGHPPPVLVLPDGVAEFLDVGGGPPLGIGGLPFESTELRVPEGALLALYSDGLLDTRNRDIDHALETLRQSLLAPTPALDDLCEGILHTLLPRRPTDDVALLLARTRVLAAEKIAVLDIPVEHSFVADARSWTAERLQAWGLLDCSFITELVVSELVTNAIRYGRPPIQLRLIRDETIICEVSDASSTAPHMRRARLSDEGGRGLLLVAQLTEKWGTRHTHHGKTIWCEQRIAVVHGLADL
ncbi:SpoIIE family protein phosphatase [Streptomyces sp. SID8361]|uniref:SpoIIE family protein phosphatase n=1 Tax=Streptomyces sp. MnatMP-M27 TaxID=1839768 RepID=UPI000B29520D|nr:SpoIIE family protein phosphatase [Streptomyces sp. MnatMP-M27]MYU10539.1 SpoIIE family protein phosphatase [Streptomyces sp. SID8361]